MRGSGVKVFAFGSGKSGPNKRVYELQRRPLGRVRRVAVLVAGVLRTSPVAVRASADLKRAPPPIWLAMVVDGLTRNVLGVLRREPVQAMTQPV